MGRLQPESTVSRVIPDTGETPEPSNSNPHRSLVATRTATGWWLSVDGKLSGAVYGCFDTQASAIRYRESMAGAWDTAQQARTIQEAAARTDGNVRRAADRLANAVMVAAINLQSVQVVKSMANCRLEARNSYTSIIQAIEAYRRAVDHA